MKYKISTVDKKSVIEKNFYEKDGKSFYIEQGYRWGYFITEDPVDVEELQKKDELMIYDYDVIDHSFDDGCWIDFNYDDEIDQDERDAIENAWEEDWYEGLEALGWSEDESEVWFHGDLEVEELTEDDGIEDHERD
jgi:hypothetical protein